MFFGLKFKDKKTVKELRKNQNFTAKELAEKLKLDTSDILKIDVGDTFAVVATTTRFRSGQSEDDTEEEAHKESGV